MPHGASEERTIAPGDEGLHVSVKDEQVMERRTHDLNAALDADERGHSVVTDVSCSFHDPEHFIGEINGAGPQCELTNPSHTSMK